MILIIDNYDSFTYNLYQMVEMLGYDTKIVKNDQISTRDILKWKVEKIIISPGPGRPEKAGNCIQIVQDLFSKIPILGVCLGHQVLGAAFGSEIRQANRILHGVATQIYHSRSNLFHGLPDPFIAARYHSLIIHSVPKEFLLTAWDKNDEIMGIQHARFPAYGIQFHPESFLTAFGQILLRNFLNEN